MKFQVLIVVALHLFISCNNSKKEVPNELKWTEGGNLHTSLVPEWKQASDENKLATCADFVSNVKEGKYNSLIELQADAIFLKNCIDEAVKSEYANNNKVAEIAAMCLVLKEAEQ